MRHLFLLILFGVSLTGFSQVKLRVSAPDSLSFLLECGDRNVTNTAVTDVSWIQNETGKIKFKVSFQALNFPAFEQTLDLKTGNFYQWEIRKIKNKLLLFQIAESKYDFLITAEDSTTEITQTPIEIYQGQLQCEIPLNEQEFEALKTRMNTCRFESQRVEELKKIVLLECLTVNQLRTLLNFMELEDNKIKLLEQAKPRIYDIDRSHLFQEDFLLERNKNRLKVLFQ